MYKRILVATDGSKLSAKAVSSAIGLAALCGAEVVALKVVPRANQSYFDGSYTLPAAQFSDIEKTWVDQANEVVATVVKNAKAKGVNGKGVVSKSDLVAEAVVAAAKKHACDLIVMASHGRKGVKRLLLGSETQHVLTHSHIPVLVLR